MATQEKDKVSFREQLDAKIALCQGSVSPHAVAAEAARLHESEVSALREENERLRKALERVAAIPNGPDRPSTAGQLQWALDIVEEALR